MQRVCFKHISQQAFGVSWLDFAVRLFATAVPLPRVSHFLILPQLCMTFLPNERQLNRCCFGLKNHMMLLDLDQRWILIFVLSVLHNICTCEHSFHSITCSWLFGRKTKITPTLSPVSVYYGAELRSAWETLIFFCICLSVCLWCVCVCLSISPVQQCGHKCSALQAAIWQKHSLVQFLSLSPLNHLILSFTVQMNILDFRVFLFFDMGFFFFSVV